MPRNKYPEQTVQKILEVSLRLFADKGYDHTTIQDIVDALGMSKGAIYHHFASKEEILMKLCEQHYHGVDWFTEIMRNTELNGLEKLRKLLLFQLLDPEKVQMDIFSKFIINNPQMIVHQLKESVHETAPIIARLIREGNQDGSIQSDCPDEAAQVFMLLINMWVNPGLFPVDQQAFLRKIEVVGRILSDFGIPLFDDELVAACRSYYDTVTDSNDFQQENG